MIKNIPEPKNDKQFCGVLIVLLIIVGVKELVNLFGENKGCESK